ncbi:uncharacterized protein LOC121996776 [Zingiber officinale]|uniref:uncharacterized protein LOC121996776 n=1 Tax=Zingiber officinale TaxID=94328 RepID=UPI001C4D3570|nr:uncharacterized protein LOC121996776 [Zingiber officinale]
MAATAAAAATTDGEGSQILSQISISGPALASIIQRFASAPADIDGLLFGHVTRLPPPDPLDDYDIGSSASPEDSDGTSNCPLAATVTGHLFLPSPFSFYDALGRIHLSSIQSVLASSVHPDASCLGWFSGRRQSPLRLSMRERAVSFSMFKTLSSIDVAQGVPPTGSSLGCRDVLHRPSIFLLLSSSASGNQAVHTHEYRAFVFRPSAGKGVLEPTSMKIVNLGPLFRAQYNSFSAQSGLPWMPCHPRGSNEANKLEGESLNQLRQLAREQQQLDDSTGGFEVDRLGRLVGSVATEYTSELEDLYEKMMLKLESLAKVVDESSAKILEQENRVSELKRKGRMEGLDFESRNVSI